MNHIGLFEGIGGFSLAASWMGWETIAWCEINKFCQKVLKYHFSNAKGHSDIKTTNFTIYQGQCDILTGGDPCQPSSIAGLGKGTEDDRYLWPDMFRAIREIQPFTVVNENVDGTITNGILDRKIDDLESEGYTCQAYIIPAESTGAIHKRDRVWLVATNSDFKRPQKQYIANKPIFKKKRDVWNNCFGTASPWNTTRNQIESIIIRMLDGLPEGMDYPERNKRIAALGNAIVPQVALQIFKAIEQNEQHRA